MDIQTYRRNREKFSEEDLRPYDGKWAAFSADGSRVVAAADDIAALHDTLVAAGVDPEEVGFERIVLNDTWQGATLELV